MTINFKPQKTLSRFSKIFMILVLVVGVGGLAYGLAYSVQAALTLDATSVVGSTTLTLNGAAGSAITIGNSAQTAAITLGDTASSTVTEISVGGGNGIKTINIGDGTGANTITIGAATSTGVSITDNNWSITTAGVGTLVNLLVSASATTGVDTGAAGALSLGNVTATSASLCNSAACDTITIGTNADADTITIGDATDTAVSILEDNWGITTAGVGTLVNLLVSPSATTGLDTGSAGALSLGNVTATSASICNSAACDTITIGTNADADTITIGDATDTAVSILEDNWGVTTAGVATFVTVTANAHNVTNGAAFTASSTPTKANLQAASFWPVTMPAGVLDIDIPAMDAVDIGRHLTFAVTTATANAFTVTAGAGMTVVTILNIAATAAGDDVGDYIDCLITTTATATCVTFATD